MMDLSLVTSETCRYYRQHGGFVTGDVCLYYRQIDGSVTGDVLALSYLPSAWVRQR